MTPSCRDALALMPCGNSLGFGSVGLAHLAVAARWALVK